jgi:serine/threonine protein kinase
MLDEEEDSTQSVSMTWSIDEAGTMHHKATGMKVSPESGISFPGSEYKLRPQDIIVEENSRLGAGAGGVVSKGVISTTGQPVAIKVIKVDDKAKRDQLINEIRGLVQAQGCPYLVQWYAGFANSTNLQVSVALEFMDLGSLADLKKRMANKGMSGAASNHVAAISAQVTLGLCHLHSKHILHRDIKLENILHNREGRVKLTDFGIAKDLDATLAVAGTFVGTVTYMSPERCLGEDYTFISDIWSVGMVIYEISTGNYPFKDISSFPALFDHLCEKPEPRLDEGAYPPEQCEYVANSLVRDVAKRWDAERLLTHPFVSGFTEADEQELARFFATLA